MKKTIVLILFPLLLVLVITLFSVAPAFADPVGKYIFPVDNWEYWEGSDSPCEFGITYHDWGVIRGLYWLDKNGQSIINFESAGQISMEFLANGKSLSGNNRGPVHGYFTEDVVTVHFLGTGQFVTIPGYGPVFGIAGQSISVFTYNPETDEWDETEVKSVGTVNNMTDEDRAAFCDYLSP